MDQEYEATPQTGNRIVYVRPVDVADLPDDVKAQVGTTGVIYSVNSSDGERLALVRDRRQAFVLARQNDLAPVSVH